MALAWFLWVGEREAKMTTKEKKTVRNFQGAPKNLRHVSSPSRWVKTTGGQRKGTLIGQEKEQTKHSDMKWGHMCVHSPFIETEQTEMGNKKRVNQTQTKVRVTGLCTCSQIRIRHL